MIYVPEPIIILTPVLVMWWTHRRVERKEYTVLLLSIVALCVPLIILAQRHRQTAISYEGPLSSWGINTMQIPLAIAVTAAITMLPVNMKLLRGFAAILFGEFVLHAITWIS